MSQNWAVMDERSPLVYVNASGDLVPTPNLISKLEELNLSLDDIANMSDAELEELGLGNFLKKVAKKLIDVVRIGSDKKKDAPKAEPGTEEWEKQHPRGEDGRFVNKPGEEGQPGPGEESPEWPVESAGPAAGRLGEDPFVTEHDGQNVLIESRDGSDLTVSYVDLKTLKPKQETVVWGGEKNMWAPELHKIDGNWHIFYTSTDGSDNNEDHRMYALSGGKSPFGPYTKKTKLGPPDVWGIDMTPFKVGKKNYVTWSGWDNKHDGFPQNIYVAELKTGKDGSLSTGKRVKIASPSGWEGQILEGPQTLRDPKGNLVLTYSGNKSWSTDYSLGAIKFKGGDPLNKKNWKKQPRPLARNVGHGSWVGNKHVFHVKTTRKEGWDDRELRVAEYTWKDGLPVLTIPK